MSPTKKIPKDRVRISVDDIILDLLRYLGNITDYFQVLREQKGDDLPDVFTRIVPELEQQRKRLADFQRRRAAQVRSQQGMVVSANVDRLLEAMSEQEWFQKSYWGRSTGLRIVSRGESIGIAIKAIIIGVAYIHHIPTSHLGGIRKWMTNFHTTMIAYLAEFIDNQYI